MTRILCLASIVCFLAWPQASAQVVVRGDVSNATTGRRLSDVHVLDTASGRGTITNTEGRFEIVLPGLPATVVIRHIGYLTQVLIVERDSPRVYSVELDPSVVPLDEVIIAGDDLAENVMRKVIQRKSSDWQSVNSWSARAYFRNTLSPTSSGEREADHAVASIRESVFDVYFRRDAGIREVLRSYRETDELYRLFGIASYGYVPNFYDDEIELGGRTFVGPTNPEALRVYTFSFAGIRSIDGRRVYDIYVAPRTDAGVSLIGTVSILAEENVMVESVLRPARHVEPLPPRTYWGVGYTQQFLSADGDGNWTGDGPISEPGVPWVPVALTVQGLIEAEDGQRTRLEARLIQTAVFGEYTVNAPVPDSWFTASDRQQIDSATVYADYLFTLGANIVALSPMELRAYELARRGVAAIKNTYRVPGPRDILSILTPRISEADGARYAWPTIYGYTPFLRYNRVDGLLSGIGQLGRPTPASLVDWYLAQATGWRRVRYRFRYERMLGERFWIGGIVEKDAFPNQVFSRVGSSVAGLGALSGRGDFFDYHTAIRKTVSVGAASNSLRVTTSLRYTKADSVARGISRSWPSNHRFRANPASRVGDFAEFVARVAVGQFRDPYSVRPPKRVELNVVASPPGVLDSDGYLAVNIGAGFTIPTLGGRRNEPANLDILVQAGATRGRSPYKWSLDGAVAGFGPFGSLRSQLDKPVSADIGAAVFWRHDFGRIPFDLIGLDRSRVLGAGVSIHGAHAAVSRADSDLGFRHEIGFGLSNPFGLPVELLLSRSYTRRRWLFGFTLRN